MTKLKTLKEITNKIGFRKIPILKGIEDCAFDWMKNELRQEAIKWIKELQLTAIGSCNIGKFKFQNTVLDPHSQATILINWIKYFFNITEEDLK